MFPVLGLEFTWFLLAPIHFPLYWRRLWLKSHMMGLFDLRGKRLVQYDAEIVCFLSLRSSERLMVFFGKVFRQKCQEGDILCCLVAGCMTPISMFPPQTLKLPLQSGWKLLDNYHPWAQGMTVNRIESIHANFICSSCSKCWKNQQPPWRKSVCLRVVYFALKP